MKKERGREMVFKVIKSWVDIHNKRFFEIISPPSVLSTACRRINSSVALCNTFYEEERERERERKKRKKERKWIRFGLSVSGV